MKRQIFASTKQLKKYTFKNGDVVTSYLDADELIKRMNRLDCLRVLTENFDDGEGASIAKKAWVAENKSENFTGTIRLTSGEKEFLGYILENEGLTDEDVECIKYYTR